MCECYVGSASQMKSLSFESLCAVLRWLGFVLPCLVVFDMGAERTARERHKAARSRFHASPVVLLPVHLKPVVICLSGGRCMSASLLCAGRLIGQWNS